MKVANLGFDANFVDRREHERRPTGKHLATSLAKPLVGSLAIPCQRRRKVLRHAAAVEVHVAVIGHYCLRDRVPNFTDYAMIARSGLSPSSPAPSARR
jgi:hypothetical protein